MTTLPAVPNAQQQQDLRRQLDAARDKALKAVDDAVKQERADIWTRYYAALEQIGLDKHGKPKVRQ